MIEHNKEKICLKVDLTPSKSPSSSSKPSKLTLKSPTTNFSEDEFRQNLKRKLEKCLETRLEKSCPEEERISPKISYEFLSEKIEEVLYSHFKTSDKSYKSQMSLILNSIRDTELSFALRLVSGQVDIQQLATMKADGFQTEMAEKEAEITKKYIKSNFIMKPFSYIKKDHKGETILFLENSDERIDKKEFVPSDENVLDDSSNKINSSSLIEHSETEDEEIDSMTLLSPILNEIEPSDKIWNGSLNISSSQSINVCFRPTWDSEEVDSILALLPETLCIVGSLPEEKCFSFIKEKIEDICVPMKTRKIYSCWIDPLENSLDYDLYCNKLSQENKVVVVGNCDSILKDFYIVALDLEKKYSPACVNTLLKFSKNKKFLVGLICHKIGCLNTSNQSELQISPQKRSVYKEETPESKKITRNRKVENQKDFSLLETNIKKDNNKEVILRMKELASLVKTIGNTEKKSIENVEVLGNNINRSLMSPQNVPFQPNFYIPPNSASYYPTQQLSAHLQPFPFQTHPIFHSNPNNSQYVHPFIQRNASSFYNYQIPPNYQFNTFNSIPSQNLMIPPSFQYQPQQQSTQTSLNNQQFNPRLPENQFPDSSMRNS